MFAGEALLGLIPIWMLNEWRAKRLKIIPPMEASLMFIAVFTVGFRLSETILARYWIAHFDVRTLPGYLSLVAWLIASVIATVVVVIFFRRKLDATSKLQDHF
jgi:hypothetical protein